jgi:hypothetical protein
VAACEGVSDAGDKEGVRGKDDFKRPNHVAETGKSTAPQGMVGERERWRFSSMVLVGEADAVLKDCHGSGESTPA